MIAQPFLGVFLHALGGLAAGSFYLPYKRVRGWAWELYWLVGGVFSWLIAPWVAAALTSPRLIEVLRGAPSRSLLLTYLFGVLWGVGGLTFGLSMRYLGLSLGMALALGFCAVFGTIVPPVFQGQIGSLASILSGRIILAGVVVCLAGIAVCGRAGARREKEVPAADRKAVLPEFNFVKGLWVAVFSGIMSSCMAFAYAVGKPIAARAVGMGTPDLFQNFPVMIVALAGGFTTNAIWCGILLRRNRRKAHAVADPAARVDPSAPKDRAPFWPNLIFSALAGVTWYLQFFFYGMGTTRMGRYDFSSWTIHMAFIILFSNLWGLWLREWKGSGRRTMRLVAAGLLILVLSTVVVGAGNYVAAVMGR
ncbi:MAG: L-rhamnose/proton symporter RhaT [Acidobacteriota bacterium]|nr:L-rhamnose/proton symporter RhaT [Acidobacteriota bacterium]